jgi:hypothetical protein
LRMSGTALQPHSRNSCQTSPAICCLSHIVKQFAA